MVFIHYQHYSFNTVIEPQTRASRLQSSTNMRQRDTQYSHALCIRRSAGRWTCDGGLGQRVHSTALSPTVRSKVRRSGAPPAGAIPITYSPPYWRGLTIHSVKMHLVRRFMYEIDITKTYYRYCKVFSSSSSSSILAPFYQIVLHFYNWKHIDDPLSSCSSERECLDAGISRQQHSGVNAGQGWRKHIRSYEPQREPVA